MDSPEIQLFNAIFAASTGLGYTTIDYSPVKDDGVPYPFVFVAETNSDDVINNKDVITGILRQTVHVWGYANDRGLFSDMVFQLKQQMRKLTHLENYYVELEGLQSNAIFDNTTDDSLLHGIIDVEYNLS